MIKLIEKQRPIRLKEFEITGKPSSEYIRWIIKSGKEKYVKLRYMSDLWLRFKIEKYFIQNKFETELTLPEPVGKTDTNKNISLEVLRPGIFNKFAIFLLTFWLYLLPLQTTNVNYLFERYASANLIKGKKTRLIKKQTLLSKIFYASTKLVYGIEKQSLNEIQNFIPQFKNENKSINIKLLKEEKPILIILDSLNKIKLSTNLGDFNKGTHKINLTSYYNQLDNGKYRLEVFYSGNMFSCILNKINNNRILTGNRTFLLNQEFIELVKKQPAQKESRNLISRSKFLKSVSFIGAAMFLPLPKNIFAGNNLNVYVPDVEGIKYTGSTVDVYDDFDNLLGSGTTIDSLASFVVTDVENQNGINAKTGVSFNPISNDLTYNLDGFSRVRVILSDVLGRTKTLYSGNGQYGENHLNVNLNKMASGHYFVVVQTEKYQATVPLTKINGMNKLSMGVAKVQPMQKKSLGSNRLLKANGDNYKIVVSNPTEHYTRTFVVPVQNNIEDRVVGYDGKDSDGNIIRVIDDGNMAPERFKQWMDWSYFNAVFNPDYTNPINIIQDGIAKWIDSSNGKYPDSIQIFKNSQRPEGVSTFSDEAIQLIKDSLYHLFTFMPQQIPIEVKEFRMRGPPTDEEWQHYLIENDNYMGGIMQSGISGHVNAWTQSTTQVREDGFPNYTNENLTALLLQEHMSSLFGARGPPQDDSIVSPYETITRDNSWGFINDLTKYDAKSVRILTEDYFKPGQKSDDILGL